MLNKDDFQRLGRLLNNLHLLTGIKFSLMDEWGNELYASSFKAPFCGLIMQEESGFERCHACDRKAAEEVGRTQVRRKYLCHAGLYEVALPVTEKRRTVATILFGQMLDDAPREEQWRRVAARCAWYPDQDALYQAFLRLHRISARQMTACLEIVQACVSEVRLSGLQATSRRDDAELLQSYIDTHYAQALDSTGIAEALNVGKTKLYTVCKEHFQLTPMQLVTCRRMQAAMDLLLNTAEPVKYVARAVGIADENYFTKVFKAQTGDGGTMPETEKGWPTARGASGVARHHAGQLDFPHTLRTSRQSTHTGPSMAGVKENSLPVCRLIRQVRASHASCGLSTTRSKPIPVTLR